MVFTLCGLSLALGATLSADMRAAHSLACVGLSACMCSLRRPTGIFLTFYVLALYLYAGNA